MSEWTKNPITMSIGFTDWGLAYLWLCQASD